MMSGLINSLLQRARKTDPVCVVSKRDKGEIFREIRRFNPLILVGKGRDARPYFPRVVEDRERP